MERDTKVKDLVEVMNNIFTFVAAADPLGEIAAHEKIIALMIQQVTDCGYFIRDYAEDKSFCRGILFGSSLMVQLNVSEGKRVAKHPFSDADQQIGLYLRKFAELKEAFQLEASREIHIIVLRVLDDLQSLDAKLEVLAVLFYVHWHSDLRSLTYQPSRHAHRH